MSQLSQTNHVTLCIVHTVLQTKVDAYCNKATKVVGQTKLITLATIDVPWRKKAQLSSSFGEGSRGKYQNTPESPLTQCRMSTQ